LPAPHPAPERASRSESRRVAHPDKTRPRKENHLWPQSRRLRPGSSTEAQLVEKYLPLVRTVVARVAMTLPPHVDSEDLYSAGLSGLLNAVRQYDPTAGTAFETYARLRIRGAILDELRRMDWVPRSVHTKARKVQSAMQALEQSKGRLATEQEMAKALKISPAEYQEWLEEIRPADVHLPRCGLQ
jgi:RNA polymerase sigma factor for flagellar operon FliA